MNILDLHTSDNKLRLVFVYFSLVNIEIFTKLLVFSSIRLKLASLALVLQYMILCLQDGQCYQEPLELDDATEIWPRGLWASTRGQEPREQAACTATAGADPSAGERAGGGVQTSAFSGGQARVVPGPLAYGSARPFPCLPCKSISLHFKFSLSCLRTLHEEYVCVSDWRQTNRSIFYLSNKFLFWNFLSV